MCSHTTGGERSFVSDGGEGARLAGGVGAGFGDRREAGEPFEVAPGREDDVGAAGIDLGEDVRRARPEGADRFVRADARPRRARRGFGEEEERVEAPGLAEVRAPAGERRQRLGIER